MNTTGNELDGVELHDAILIKIEVDVIGNFVSIALRYYESEGSHERTSATIKFTRVENISTILGLPALIDNSKSGNINSWSGFIVGRETFIHVLDGCICIKADEINIEKHQSD